VTVSLFRRAARVTVYRSEVGSFGDPATNGLEITDLRVQFAITKGTGSDPNTCEMVITNAAPDTRASLTKKPLHVRIDAGYDDDLKHLFRGDLRYGASSFQPPEWFTKLQIADGDRAYRHAKSSRSYKRGTTVLTALKDVAATMGLALPANALVSADLKAQFASGEVIHGPSRDELTKLLAPYGYRWSIQDGKLVILKEAETRPDRALVVSQATGMIGSPEFGVPDKSGKTPALTVKMLLYPAITPGGKIEIQSRTINGVFKVEKVTHTGDTHGDDWFTEVECKPVTVNKVQTVAAAVGRSLL